MYESDVYDYSSFTCDAAQASRDGYNLWKADVGSQVISALITTSPSLTYVPEPAAFFVQLAAIATLLGLTRSRSRQV